MLYRREKEAFDRMCMSEHRCAFRGLAPVVRVVVGNALALVLHRLQELEGPTVIAAEYRAQKASELMDGLVRYLHDYGLQPGSSPECTSVALRYLAERMTSNAVLGPHPLPEHGTHRKETKTNGPY